MRATLACALCVLAAAAPLQRDAFAASAGVLSAGPAASRARDSDSSADAPPKPGKFVFVAVQAYTSCPWFVSEIYDKEDKFPNPPPKPLPMLLEKRNADSLDSLESLGQKTIPSEEESAYCKRVADTAALNPTGKSDKRSGEMASKWVQQLQWAWGNIPEQTRADKNIVKVVTFPEWMFRADPGAEPLSSAEVASIRATIQQELKRYENGAPVYELALVVSGSFYYGAQVSQNYNADVNTVEDHDICGANEPPEFYGRRPWVESATKPPGGNKLRELNRAYAMFNCADVYFVRAKKGETNLRGPYIRCKAMQCEVARQTYPYREVWGRCAVENADGRGRAFSLSTALTPGSMDRMNVAKQKSDDALNRLLDAQKNIGSLKALKAPKNVIGKQRAKHQPAANLAPAADLDIKQQLLEQSLPALEENIMTPRANSTTFVGPTSATFPRRPSSSFRPSPSASTYAPTTDTTTPPTLPKRSSTKSIIGTSTNTHALRKAKLNA